MDFIERKNSREIPHSLHASYTPQLVIYYIISFCISMTFYYVKQQSVKLWYLSHAYIPISVISKITF